MKRTVFTLGTGLLVAASAAARDYDPAALAGTISDNINSKVIYGAGAPLPLTRYLPWVLPAGDSGQNGAVVARVNGDILGGVTTFSSAGNPNVVAYFGALDELANDPNFGFVSNNIVIRETGNRSNTLGEILPDGALVYRANFNGTVQNNLELVLGNVLDQVGVPPSQNPLSGQEPETGTELLDGICTSGGPNTNCQLSIPAAIPAVGAGGGVGAIWLANTNFNANDATPGVVPNGVNVWFVNVPAPADIGAPDYNYTQTGANTFAAANGVIIAAGNERQSSPVLRRVCGHNYVIFGIGDSSFPVGGTAGATGGGSGGRRPLLLCIDAFQDGDGYANAVALLPPAGYMFVDHQANGGGAGNDAFNNKKFDINSCGQLAAVAETVDVATNQRTAAVLLYDPVFGPGNRIVGFAPNPQRFRIADGGPLGDPDDIIDDGLAGGINLIPPIAGVGINDAGNLAFTANYRTDADPNVIRTAVYFYDQAADTLHRVTVENEIVGGGLELGLFSTRDSDSFSAPGLADNSNLIATCFREGPDPFFGGFRGVLVVDVGLEFTPQSCCAPSCPGDVNGDGVVNQSDLGILLANFGQNVPPGTLGDLNGDGVVGQPDLGILLANFGCGE
ncbi:MAG: hypothetical protein LC135_04670 [Phycisphaerae bacterium]|nr:hypothetical protein [Phycisphaerae bacterium]MCZ2399148.1 hypothetical protein [Phycisphaerae bacterium]NUQ50617.1 hypothetical protein [Phycisphaerae bacterium]